MRYVVTFLVAFAVGSMATYTGWIFGWHRGYDAGLEDAPPQRVVASIEMDRETCLAFMYSDGEGEYWCPADEHRAMMRERICGAVDI